MNWLRKIRAVLGKLTDALMWGRSRGLWTEKHGPGTAPSELDRPHQPGDGPR